MADDSFEEFEKRARDVDPFETSHTANGWVVIGAVFLIGCVLWIFAGPSYFYRFIAPPSNSGDTASSAAETGSSRPAGDGTIPGRKPDEMAVVFLNVGYGDGILVQAPDNKTSLIDGGEGAQPEEEGVEAYDWARELYFPLLDDLGIPSLHRLVSTTPLSHHMGAQTDLIADQKLSVKEIVFTGFPASFYSFRSRQLAARDRNVPINDIDQGDQIDFGPGIESQVLYGDDSAKFPDAASHVLLIQYGDIRFLLMSDLPSEREQELTLEWADSLDAEVLKVGSHANRDSNSLELLRFVEPDQAVISVSRRNPVMAPHKETLERLRKAGVDDSRLFRTDIDGHIGFYTDGDQIRVETDILPEY